MKAKTYLQALEAAEALRQKELPKVIERIKEAKEVYKLRPLQIFTRAELESEISKPAANADAAIPRKKVAKKPLRLVTGKKAPYKSIGRKYPVRYRDPTNPENTWTGQGTMSRWLREKKDAGEDIARYKVTA